MESSPPYTVAVAVPAEAVGSRRTRGERRRRGPGELSGVQVAVVGAGNESVAELAETLGLETPQFYARGHRGVVFVSRRGGEDAMVAIKRPRRPGDEARWLERCNALGIGPRLVARGRDGAFAAAFVMGTPIGEVLEHTVDASFVRALIADLLGQCAKLDASGIEKGEMVRLNRHVLISGRAAHDVKCTMIDFERCSFVKKGPQNVTQCCQYLTSAWVRGQLSRLGIEVDVDAVRRCAAAYKKRSPLEDGGDEIGGIMKCFGVF